MTEACIQELINSAAKTWASTGKSAKSAKVQLKILRYLGYSIPTHLNFLTESEFAKTYGDINSAIMPISFAPVLKITDTFADLVIQCKSCGLPIDCIAINCLNEPTILCKACASKVYTDNINANRLLAIALFVYSQNKHTDICYQQLLFCNQLPYNYVQYGDEHFILKTENLSFTIMSDSKVDMQQQLVDASKLLQRRITIKNIRLQVGSYQQRLFGVFSCNQYKNYGIKFVYDNQEKTGYYLQDYQPNYCICESDRQKYLIKKEFQYLKDCLDYQPNLFTIQSYQCKQRVADITGNFHENFCVYYLIQYQQKQYFICNDQDNEIIFIDVNNIFSQEKMRQHALLYRGFDMDNIRSIVPDLFLPQFYETKILDIFHYYMSMIKIIIYAKNKPKYHVREVFELLQYAKLNWKQFSVPEAGLYYDYIKEVCISLNIETGRQILVTLDQALKKVQAML